MKTIKHLDLFSGVGGLSLAARNVFGKQYQNVGFCEIDPFLQESLGKNFPGAKIYADIRTITKRIPTDIITGGFPCQPFSSAGKRGGTEDNRYLWPEMFRVIRLQTPEWVIAENVSGLLTYNNGMVFESICTDLEGRGYEVWPFIIPAFAVGAPHRRDRVWIVAHLGSKRLKRPGIKSSKKGARGKAPVRNDYWGESLVEAVTEFCGVVHGVSQELDKGKRIHALGNAIVPQVAEMFYKAIKEIEL